MKQLIPSFLFGGILFSMATFATMRFSGYEKPHNKHYYRDGLVVCDSDTMIFSTKPIAETPGYLLLGVKREQPGKEVFVYQVVKINQE